ncbi:FAD-binding protein [Myxococcota bacterium]|nr:FAD-binding protein [Myxococcota bacterium]
MGPFRRLGAAGRRELLSLLGPDAVLADPALLDPYRGDFGDRSEEPPEAVVFPRTTRDVQAVLALASREGVPVTPRGAGTGKAGGCAPLHGGIVLSTSRMNGILEIHEGGARAVVEPGVVTRDLREAAEARGLFYPPDPASLDTCTLGGNAATNAGGPMALKYGVTREHVLGLEAVLPDGRILNTGRRTLKGVAGYDLTALLVGSEGTLAVLTRLVLRLRPRPRAVETALVPFATVEAAARAVPRIWTSGIQPRVLELLDGGALAAVRRRGAVPVGEGWGAVLLVETDGEPGGCREEMDRLLDRVADAVEAPRRSRDEGEREALWAVRREMSAAVKEGARGWSSEDVTVPTDRIAALCAYVGEVAGEGGLRVAIYGHAGDGNLHVNLLYDAAAGRARLRDATERIYRRTLDEGGTLTGEHGIGSTKRAWLPWEQDETALGLQRDLKRIFDPKGILNPGKVLP